MLHIIKTKPEVCSRVAHISRWQPSSATICGVCSRRSRSALIPTGCIELNDGCYREAEAFETDADHLSCAARRTSADARGSRGIGVTGHAISKSAGIFNDHNDATLAHPLRHC